MQERIRKLPIFKYRRKARSRRGSADNDRTALTRFVEVSEVRTPLQNALICSRRRPAQEAVPYSRAERNFLVEVRGIRGVQALGDRFLKLWLENESRVEQRADA